MKGPGQALPGAVAPGPDHGRLGRHPGRIGRLQLCRRRRAGLAAGLAPDTGVRLPLLAGRDRVALVRYFSLGLDEQAPVEVGFLAQFPTGAGCTATFTDIAFVPELLADIRSGV